MIRRLFERLLCAVGWTCCVCTAQSSGSTCDDCGHEKCPSCT